MKFFGMGSIIVASRSLAALRHQYPDDELHFLTFKSNKGILDILRMTDHHHYLDPQMLERLATLYREMSRGSQADETSRRAAAIRSRAP